MTDKEKAQAYDEALNWMRTIYPSLSGADKEDAEHFFPDLRESEDERIRKHLVDMVKRETGFTGFPSQGQVLAYLEKQKERGPLTKDEEYELHRIIEFLKDETCPSEWISLLHDIYCLPYEKHEETSKAIEAVDRIDKYIDEHLANAHDMKDSNPDKKYYRGWDDALGKMAGILQDVYSGEKQKESLRDFIDDFPYSDEQKEQKPTESISQLSFEGKGVYKICPRCKERMIRDDSKVYTSMPPQYRYNCPKCGAMEFDTVIYDNPEMEEQKPVVTHGETYHVDTLGTQQVIAGKMPQKHMRDIVSCDAIESCMLRYLQSAANRNDDTEIIEDTKAYKSELISIIEKEQSTEWSEKDERMKNRLIDRLNFIAYRQPTDATTVCMSFESEISWLKSLSPQSRWRPTEEQMLALADTLEHIPEFYKPKCTLESLERDLKKL